VRGYAVIGLTWVVCLKLLLHPAGVSAGTAKSEGVALTDVRGPLGLAPAAEHASADAAGGHSGSAGQGSEQPNFLTPVADLGIWTLVVFLLLLWVLKRLAWKPMLEALEKREACIRQALEDAERARQEAERTRAQLQKQLDECAGRIREMLDEARRDGERLVLDMQDKARQEIAAERERMRREIELARDQALQEVWQQAVRLAGLLATKLLRRQITPDDHRRLIDEALVELRQAAQAERRERIAAHLS